MQRAAKIWTVSAASGGLMVLATWLFEAEQSPIYEYAMWHVSIGNALTLLSFPALLLGTVVSGNVHQPSLFATYLGIFVQWAMVGFVVASIVTRRRRTSQRSGGDA